MDGEAIRGCEAIIPQIFSMSYGEDKTPCSFEVASRLKTEFQKADARDISLLFASGDEG